MSVSDYSKGLRHGREDLAKLIAAELAADVPDAVKLERIAWLVAALTDERDRS